MSDVDPQRPTPPLRSRTRRALRPSGPPSESIPVVWTGPDGVDRETALSVIDLAMRVSVALMSTGSSAADVVGTVLRLTRAYGLRGVHVDVTFSAVAVSYHRGPTAEPLTLIRVVRTRSQDYARLEQLRRLVVDLGRDPLPAAEARRRFDAVIEAPHPYRRWVATVAVAALGAGAAAIVGAGPLIMALSALSSALVDKVQRALRRLGVEAFFTQAVGSAIPTLIAIALSLVQRGTGLLDGVLPSLVVASGIVVLLSGLSLVGSAQDAIEGFSVTAGARLFEVLILTLGIVVGITVVLSLFTRLGVTMTISGDPGSSTNDVVQVAAAVVIAGAFALISHSPGGSVIAAALAGGVGWAIYLGMTGLAAGRPTASAVAAFLVGVTAQLSAHRLRVAALAVMTASIVPLLPGSVVYRGIFEIVSDPSGPGFYQGLATLLEAVGVGVGIAAGVSLGTYVARLVQDTRSGHRRRR
ncbi:MAG: threonine/serine exporter family protein, partial [Lapillicoccus sp.]